MSRRNSNNDKKLMTNQEIFELYKQVQRKDRKAEDKLIALHKRRFPQSTLYLEAEPGEVFRRTALHTMYLHLTQ